MTASDSLNEKASGNLRINMQLTGPLAQFALELRRTGHYRSIPDMVCEALRCLQDKFTERELAKARLHAVKRASLDTSDVD